MCLDENFKLVLSTLELKYRVSNLLASIENLEIIKDRIELIRQARLQKAIEGDT